MSAGSCESVRAECPDPGNGHAVDYEPVETGQLAAIGTVVSYEHDALCRRVARQVDNSITHRFLYADRINPVAEVDANGNTVTTFVYGTGINVPDYMERGGDTYAFVRDHLGSVRFVVDADTGAVARNLQTLPEGT